VVTWLVAASPVVIPAVLLLTSRTGAIGAGATGLVLALVAAVAVSPSDAVGMPSLTLAVARGLWLAVHAAAIIAAGAAFHHLVDGWPGSAPADTTGSTGAHRAVFSACFLVGPLVESATGFGIGMVVAIGLLRAQRLGGAPAAVLAMFSQLLIPWGSLAISTVVAADLAGVSFPALALACAAIAAALLIAVLPVFWALVGRALASPSRAARAVDVAMAAALGVLLYAANRLGAIEPAVLLAAGILLALQSAVRCWWDRSLPDVRGALPYLILIASLVATRLVPELRDTLTSFAVFDPLGSGPPLAAFHHPATWLVITIAASLALRPGVVGVGELARRALATAWRPVVASALFLALGRILVTGGIPAQLVAPVSAVAGDLATLATPLIAAAAGAVAASNLAANGMVMPLQVQLAETGRGGAVTVAAIQNVVGAAFTALSPARVTLAASLLDIPGAERSIYRCAAGFALTIVAVGFGALLIAGI